MPYVLIVLGLIFLFFVPAVPFVVSAVMVVAGVIVLGMRHVYKS